MKLHPLVLATFVALASCSRATPVNAQSSPAPGGGGGGGGGANRAVVVDGTIASYLTGDRGQILAIVLNTGRRVILPPGRGEAIQGQLPVGTNVHVEGQLYGNTDSITRATITGSNGVTIRP